MLYKPEITFMRFSPKQCAECPFKPTSMPMWLGAYTPGDVFRAIWKADPFFCHTTINYEDKNWLDKAMVKGKLCTGGLLFANLICAPASEIRHEPIRIARLRVLDHSQEIECMDGKQFSVHHTDENRATWFKNPEHKAPASFGKRRRVR